MKKVIFALAAVVALAACSKEQTVVMPEGNAIGFNTFVDKATRSAVDPSYTNDKLFANFGVFGTVEGAELFNNKTVSGSGINGTWTYEGTQYWIAGAKYNFAAVAPKTVKVNDVDTNVYTNAAYTVTSNGEGAEKTYSGTTILSFVNNGKIDLLYAEATAVGEAGSGDAENPANEKVGFNFRHVLSKVKFSFQNDYNATNSFIAVKNVKIQNATVSANATLNEDTEWNGQAGAFVLDFGHATDNEATDPKEATVSKYACNGVYETEKELLLIPGAAIALQDDTNAGYKVTFDVELYIGEALIRTYNHVAYANFTPVAGNCYDIKTAINTSNIDPLHQQEAIQFTVTAVEGWSTDDNGNAVGDNNKVM